MHAKPGARVRAGEPDFAHAAHIDSRPPTAALVIERVADPEEH
jgi:hypothetical protein